MAIDQTATTATQTRRVVLMLFALVLLAGALGAAPAFGEDPVDPQGVTAAGSSNLLADPGAEAGMAGWTGSGFQAVAYGSSVLVSPVLFATTNSLGSSLFFANTPGASVTQTIPVSLNPTDHEVRLAGLLGGAGTVADGAALDVQALDGDGNTLGAPIRLGPVSAQDRGAQTTLRVCEGFLPVPAGARAVRVTLTAIGTFGGEGSAIADALVLAPRPLGIAVAATATFYTQDPLQGPHCFQEVPHTLEPPPVTTPPPPRTRPAPAHPRVSHVTLSPHWLTLHVTAPARIRVVLARRIVAPQRHARSAPTRVAWQHISAFRQTLRAAGSLRHRITPALRAGRYRITITLTTNASTRSVVATRRLAARTDRG